MERFVNGKEFQSLYNAANDAKMYTEIASELCSEISALEWVLER